jgi:tRNA A-37 threonylcarbamoyl transferase component Bud32
MAEAEVNITYRTAPVATFSTVLAVAVPVGAVYVAWSLFAMLVSAAFAPVDLSRVNLLILSQIATWCVMLGVYFMSRDSQVFLSSDGISLPFFVLPLGIPRTQIAWSSLSAVKFDARGAGRLVLWFGPKRVVFNLRYLKPDHVEQLCVALDVWAEGADRFPALLEARSRLPGRKQLEARSYTDMWEEELARRFGATNFIPLEPNHKVRGGDFIVDRQMAFGGASAIYLVHDLKHHKFVLKEAVVPADSDDELRNKSIEMLQREAQYLRQLQHPALAHVLDYFVDEGRHYLLMEYIDGIDLRRLVREKGVRKVSDVINYAEQIADIISYLHGQNPPLIHRDLTPDNIILREDETIAVIDFGASNHFIGTATQTLIGKQAYMPAEQLRGKSDQRSDIYSFGATLYFLLTGQDPEPLSASHPKADNAKVPTALDELVAQCTQLEAVDRPQSMTDVHKRILDLKAYVK